MIHPFTPSYIAMAKAAEEIQKLRNDPGGFTQPRIRSGDWFQQKNHHGEEVVWLACDGSRDGCEVRPATPNDFEMEDYSFSWLPRLDQLLGMLGTPADFIYAITRPCDGPGVQFYDDEDEKSDWHELVLKWVMREKYGKTWRDGQWLKS